MSLISILFSAQARKAWASLAGAVAVSATLHFTGIDVSTCADEIGGGLSKAINGGIQALPLGLGSLVAAFLVPNRSPRSGR